MNCRAVYVLLAVSAVAVAAVLFAAADRQPLTAEGVQRSAVPSGSRQVALTYAVSIDGLPPTPTQVVAWVPLPADNEHQTLRRWRVREEFPVQVVADATYGNRFLRLDLSAAAQGSVRPSPLPLTLEFEVTRRAYSVWESGTTPADRDQLERFLLPDRLVPIAGAIAAEARRVVGDAADPLARARRLYTHVVKTLEYDKSGSGWGRGDALYACDRRRGNCTDFHSLFIAEARAVGLPARFLIGFPLPPPAPEAAIPGYHCWAEVYLPGSGWVPVDASEAHRHPEKRDFYFGSLDADRVEFTTGRDLDLPGATTPALNFVIYPHVEVDGVEHTAISNHFIVRDLRAEASSRG